MRAGRLDRIIEVQRATSELSPAGTPTDTWTKHKRLRAELVEQATGEFLSGGGETDTRAAVFRVRWVDDVTTADRVLFRGLAHDIADIVEIGRREGLELRCATKGSATP